MAFLEWRRFNFFEINKDVDGGKLAETLKEAKVTAATSGHGNLVFGDSEGNIHLISRLFQVVTFRAYELNVSLVEQLRLTAILVTIGEDEPGVNPVIKVWNLDKLDKQGHPTCVRLTRAIPNNKPAPATALCVHDNLNLMAVGFNDGSIVLYRGDVMRERNSKQKVLRDGNHPITGLAFRCTAKHTFLFAATTNSVFLFNITIKDKEIKIHLDSMGCASRCSVLAESTQDSHFMIGRNDAVYCYTPDGRGPCYAVEGQKLFLQWFRSYLVIVAKEGKTVTRATTSVSATTASDAGDMEKHMVTVLDIQNKFIVFSAPMREETKDREVDFDVEIAIRVCRHASPEDALLLARKHHKHEWYLKIQTEDRGCYKEALDYIASLEFEEAEAMMNKYGNILLQNTPEEATQFLKTLCTDYRPSNKPLVDQNMLDGLNFPTVERADPEDFLHLFLNNSERLVEFLEHLVRVQSSWSTLVYNTLIEHYLHLWAAQTDTVARIQVENKVVRLLQSSDANYDKDQTLILCQVHNFRSGILHLYEESKLYQQIVQYHIRQQDYKAVLATCRRFGNQDPSLWVQALWSCAKDGDTPSNLLGEILSVIEKERLLSPLLVVDALASSGNTTVGDVRNYLLSVLQAESELTEQEQQLIQKYQQETEHIRQQIHTIHTSTMIFQGSRCSACHHQLELPSVHFLCQHSYHQHCFQSFAENENECPACLPNNKKILDIIKSQEQNRDLHETFHSQLERAEDGFSLVADYFGRGVFNKLTVVTDPVISDKLPTIKPPPVIKPVDTFGPGAEAKLRLGEGQTSRTVPAGGVPVPEGRMRLEETRRSDYQYSSSLEANMAQPPVRTSPSPSRNPAFRATTTAATATAKNPFENDEVYDESKNPFAGDGSANPFNTVDDDYDKNLNPFAT